MPHRKRRKADEVLMLALACGATVEAAAQKAGLSRATAHRRLQDPDFQKEWQRVKFDMVRRTAGMLTAAAGEAVKTLLELQKTSVPSATRLGAARSILEIGMKVREVTDLEERLTALEERGRSQQPGTSENG